MIQQIILDVVRGVKHWKVINKLGVWRNGNTWRLEPHNDPAEVTVDDIMQGFKKYANYKSGLQEWASLVLCADNIIAFDTDTDPRFEDIVDALWDASFGEEIDLEKLEATQREQVVIKK